MESFFGFLRRTAGCNDLVDVRSALRGVEKMLKTGIVAASQKSNVSSSASFCSSRAVTLAEVDGSTVAVSVNVKLAQQALREPCMSTSSFLPTPHMAAIALVTG
ncbi:hypothetical protein HPB51_020859 [Rhipicephalus microplus]|uniref:Uncharacterized protein n=1 Tax=Rhipicephalus microplus TaxID=6941 RepID=A0A9J6EBV4_RHIMP|nr:hypothetical protein HPB51_020859 [Rhipicephalus microplus]